MLATLASSGREHQHNLRHVVMMRKSSAIINDQVQHGSHRERNQPVQEHLQLFRLPADHALPSTG